MTVYQSDFLKILSERGFIYQTSDDDALDKLFKDTTVSGYIGFDATADSLHAGSLIQIMMLHWMQQTGHRPIALMGGGTSMIGDPSLRDEARKLLTPEDIDANLAGIRKSFSSYLQFEEQGGNAIMANNADWLMGINYVEFLRDVGQHFSVNRMLSFDSVKLRLDREQSLSFLEFNYMILQAYDFAELNKRYDCQLQMGGSDQWGNIVNGIDLGRRLNGASLYALTSPLLTTSSGGKMGKSASGAVWLSADKLSVYDFWQYWRNTEDADVERFLKLYTTMPMDEIARLGALQGAELNDAKAILATEVTAMLHGRAEADKAAETARVTFAEGQTATDLPTITVDAAELDNGIGVLNLRVQGELAKSNADARRGIKGGAVKVNDTPVRDDKLILDSAQLINDGALKLSFGKKRHVLVRKA